MFPVIYEEKDWLVIDKPAGVSVHNDQNSVINHFPGYSPVHRLDKETSGLLLLSREAETTSRLQTALQKAQKKYLCICRKVVRDDCGEWTQALSEAAGGYKSPQGPKNERKPCCTIWSLRSKNKFFSVLDVEIQSGRTHQIRRHALIAGHHIVGDKRYGDKKYNQMIISRYQTDRMFLHATSLMFQFEGRKIELLSPVPVDFSKLVSF